MIPQNKIKDVIGHTKIITGKHPLARNQSTYDSDKDGYINSIDCAPNNPNKDGFISDTISAGKNWVRKKAEEVKEAPGKYVKEKEEKRVQERAFKRQAKEEYEEAYAKERPKYLKQQARQRAKAKAKAPSIGQQLMSGIQNNLKQGAKVTKKKTGYKKVVGYKKTGKGKYKKVVGYKKMKSKPKMKALSSNDKLSNLLKGSSTSKKRKKTKGMLTPKDFNFKIM